jgi:Fe2+ or Zn2+ uptake regulation protein
MVLEIASQSSGGIVPPSRPELRVNHRSESAFPQDPPSCADRLVCTRCGGVTRLDAHELLEGLHARAASRGISIESHSLTVYGRCWLCRATEVQA